MIIGNTTYEDDVYGLPVWPPVSATMLIGLANSLGGCHSDKSVLIDGSHG
jgi:hypothetical protein